MPLVTFNMTYDSLTQEVQKSANAQHSAQLHAQTGLRVITPGDDPVATAQSSLVSNGLQQLGGMQDSAQQASASLGQTDSALRSASNLMARARELVVRGLNGALTPGDRDALAPDAAALQRDMAAIANSKSDTAYLFAGNLVSSAPFADDGTYGGDTGLRQVEVAPNQSIAMNVPGSQVFNVPGGQNIIGIMQSMQAHLSANDVAGLQQDLSDLDAGSQQIANAQGNVGAQMNSLQQGTSMRQAAQLQLTQQNSQLVEVDTARALTDLLQAQQAYQAAIAEATRILTGMDNSLTR